MEDVRLKHFCTIYISSEDVNKFRFPEIKEKRFWRLFVRACHGLELSCIALRILAAHNLTRAKRDMRKWRLFFMARARDTYKMPFMRKTFLVLKRRALCEILECHWLTRVC